ncbi:MAG TPA: NUDIX hydrolase [Candidatus Saccharimonadia bacterium]|nr:NUDIX hydrolase [Candidatus Saccharimonadia bacterium]
MQSQAKKFTRIDTHDAQTFGNRYKRTYVLKRFTTEDGIEHEFTTIGKEGERAGAVLALTPDKKIVTVYQFRAGPERWMHDMPGGGIFSDEDPQLGVLRELKEETGYVPGTVEFLGTSSRDAYLNITWFYYFAMDCVLSESGRELDAEENDQGAQVRLISIEEFIDNAMHDRMSDPHAVLMAYKRLMKLKGEKDD